MNDIDHETGTDLRRLYSVNEVLEATGIGRTKLFELFANGSITSVHIGTRRLVPKAALDSFIEGLVHETEVEHGLV